MSRARRGADAVAVGAGERPPSGTVALAGTPAGPAAGEIATPRIAPLPEGEWDELLVELVRSSDETAPGPSSIFATLARHPDLFRSWLGMGGTLLYGRLPGRLRELVILRTALHCACTYEWCHHVIIARREGVGDHEIAAVRRDPAAGSWSSVERAALQAADELHGAGLVGDRTWSALAATLTEDQVIELVMLVGFYHMVAFCLRTFGVQVEPITRKVAGPAGSM